MEQAAAASSGPPHNQFLARKGKTRSWERGIIYNPVNQSLKIKSRSKIEKDPTQYMRCSLPTQPSRVDIFLNSNKSEAFAVGEAKSGGEEGKIFIGRLNLEGLGIRNQFLRLFGSLKTLYIVKHTASTPDSEEAVSEREEDSTAYR